jgi:hypothetical protein
MKLSSGAAVLLVAIVQGAKPPPFELWDLGPCPQFLASSKRGSVVHLSGTLVGYWLGSPKKPYFWVTTDATENIRLVGSVKDLTKLKGLVEHNVTVSARRAAGGCNIKNFSGKIVDEGFFPVP